MITVLIVENDPEFITMAQSLPSSADDIDIILASSGVEAVRILQESAIDIVVTDIAIQVQAGINLLAYILKQHPDKTVLVHTAFNIVNIQAKISGKGFNSISYLQKPLARDALLEAIRALKTGVLPAKLPKEALESLPYETWIEDLTAAIEVHDLIPQQPTTSSLDDTLIHLTRNAKDLNMGNVQETLETAMGIDGAMGVALVDYESGMALGMAGGSSALNLEIAAAGNTNVIRANMRVMSDLNLNDSIEDILITLNNQYHLIRLLKASKGLFLYLVLSKGQANLAMARHKLAQIENTLTI
jgi:CheY-like chemotaxis protein